MCLNTHKATDLQPMSNDLEFASNITRRNLGDSGAYLALSGGNIGQSGSIIFREIICLRLIESQPSNQGVGGSNPSGRAIKSIG